MPNGDSVLEVSHKADERSLVLYPSDLRHDFGAEMLEVFDEQVSEAYSQRGFSGLLRVCSVRRGSSSPLLCPVGLRRSACFRSLP